MFSEPNFIQDILNKFMKIGIVLANTPGYSETFFTSKIKGLQSNNIDVTLFVQNRETNFNLCKTVVSPRVFSKNVILQMPLLCFKFLLLLPYYKMINRFIKLERNEKTPWSAILKKIYLNSHIFKHKLDWLHFGFATQALGSELVAKAVEAKMAVSFRGFDIAIYPLKHPNCYTLLWKHIDKVHTISNDLLDLAYGLGLSKDTEVQKITPAIDVSVFKNENKNFNTIQNKIKILSVARLNWKKGFVDVIKALHILKEKRLDFEYTIVGEGKEYERIAFAVHQLGLEENVFFVGKKNREEVVKFYRDSHIFIQYSISEGFCNSVLEAQSMGLLCIVSNAEGLSENVKNKKTGWVVPKYNVEALANKIIEVVNLPEKDKLQVSLQAIERVKNYFTIEQQQNKFVDFYKTND